MQTSTHSNNQVQNHNQIDKYTKQTTNTRTAHNQKYVTDHTSIDSYKKKKTFHIPLVTEADTHNICKESTPLFSPPTANSHKSVVARRELVHNLYPNCDWYWESTSVGSWGAGTVHRSMRKENRKVDTIRIVVQTESLDQRKGSIEVKVWTGWVMSKRVGRVPGNGLRKNW